MLFLNQSPGGKRQSTNLNQQQTSAHLIPLYNRRAICSSLGLGKGRMGGYGGGRESSHPLHLQPSLADLPLDPARSFSTDHFAAEAFKLMARQAHTNTHPHPKPSRQPIQKLSLSCLDSPAPCSSPASRIRRWHIQVENSLKGKVLL